MSDYLFTSVNQSPGRLSHYIESIYPENPPETSEFHGDWGSLAVSKTLYSGFSPYEDENLIAVVIGGPLLKFSSNTHLKNHDPNNTATKKILERWKRNEFSPSNDLSGPFVLLIVDKKENTCCVTTDLMAFIPVWYTNRPNEISSHSTHVDALAAALSLDHSDLDPPSIGEFILSGTVTYPYSFYSSIKQLPPATKTWFLDKTTSPIFSAYYQFDQVARNTAVKTFGSELNCALRQYIRMVTSQLSQVAIFVSGGEDSRAVLSFVPARVRKDAYVLLDRENREGRIARKAAHIYDSRFHLVERNPLHYLNIIEPATQLIGPGGQYLHAHSMTFENKLRLTDYSAVLGGFAADRLLKGEHVRKWWRLAKFPALPQVPERLTPRDHIRIKGGHLLSPHMKDEIQRRREAHLSLVKAFRGDASEYEWVKIWPASMAIAAPYYTANRRLFKTYEPFLDNDVVKLAAQIPTNMKLNRRVYHSAMKPQFRKSRFVPHANGWYPYFSVWTNIPIHAFIRTLNAIKTFFIGAHHEGPWVDWEYIRSTDDWSYHLKRAKDSEALRDVLADCPMLSSFSTMNSEQKTNLFQVTAFLERNAL